MEKLRLGGLQGLAEWYPANKGRDLDGGREFETGGKSGSQESVPDGSQSTFPEPWQPSGRVEGSPPSPGPAQSSLVRTWRWAGQSCLSHRVRGESCLNLSARLPLSPGVLREEHTGE